MEKITPMLKQYLEIKKDYPDTILFFRLGDFYEMFFDDAKIASNILNLVLTSREAGKGRRVPMCGIPYHSAENYIARLLKEGYKVAICEQVEDPKRAKGLVKREVIRVITPGTVIADGILSSPSNNYIMSLDWGNGIYGISYCDLSTGEFRLTETESEEEFISEIVRISPSEVLIPEDKELNFNLNGLITKYPPWHFYPENAKEIILSHFALSTLEGLGIENTKFALSSAGALLDYLKRTQKSHLRHIRKLTPYSLKKYMILDETTQQNLEIKRNIYSGEKKGCLLSIIDHTITALGKRLLEKWITQPLLEIVSIKRRQDAVEELKEKKDFRSQIRKLLKGIIDLERLAGKLELKIITPQELLSLKNSLFHVSEIKALLKDVQSDILKQIRQCLKELPEIQELITSAIREDALSNVGEGWVIKDGFNTELDQLRNIRGSGKKWLAELEEREIKRTGITSLKIGYNRVFGYYIEVTKPNLKYVPSDYIRKQTLVNAERFITPELKEFEEKIISAEEKIKELECRIFNEICQHVRSYLNDILETAEKIAMLDVLASFAEIADKNHYIRPQLNEGEEILIEEARHPVLEVLLPAGKFVANDIKLSQTKNIIIVTGPNMAGKSTYIRQAALLVIMAQAGSFIPARSAVIGIVDRVFTRIGSRENISSGMSTFMVEMVETAKILNNATSKSLIILDEVGRGTSTYDGLSIAWAVVEYIYQKLKSRTLFATHYHELTQLTNHIPAVQNLNVAVREWQDEVVFLYKVEEGSCDRSFGIHVAKLAGVPEEVITRAWQVLDDLEERGKNIKVRKNEKQLELFQRQPKIEELRKLNLNEITPLEALNILHKLKEKYGKD